MSKTGNTMLVSMLHAGPATFMRAPLIKWDELSSVRPSIGILGAPFEGCCVGIPGASFGPRVLRQASDDLISYNLELDIDLSEHLKIVDCGDAFPVPGNTEESHRVIENGVLAIAASGAVPITMGGDHSITLPAFRAYRRVAKGKIGLIHFDSHMDTSDTYAGQKVSNCTQTTRIAEMDGVSGKNIVQIGIRNLLNPKSELENARRMGITTFFAWDVFKRGITDVTKEALRIAHNGTDSVYLTVDIDVLDAAYAPATSVPTPGGFTSRQLIEAVREVARAGVAAFDLVEVSGPQQDPNLITARAGATVIAEFMAATVLGKKTR